MIAQTVARHQNTEVYRSYNTLQVVEKETKRGVAQPGSAPEWGSGGRRFKSSRPDQ